MDGAYTPVRRKVRIDLLKSTQGMGIGCEHSERHLLAHTLWSIHKNMAFAFGSVGRMAELLDRGGKLCRPGDVI